MTVEIKDKLYKDISNYCKANHLVIKEYVNELLAKQFMVDKYGDRPGVYIVPDKPVEPPSVKENSEFPPVFTKENGHLEFNKPVEADIKPQISSNEIIPIDLPMKEPDKKNLEEIKSQETVIVVLEAKDKTDEDSEPVKEKPKRRKLK